MKALEAIESILADAGTPMTVAEITETILAQGLWHSSAKVPKQSIHSVLAGDIARKGKDSRFFRTARGNYGLSRWIKDPNTTTSTPTEMLLAIPRTSVERHDSEPRAVGHQARVPVGGSDPDDADPDGHKGLLKTIRLQLWRTVAILRGVSEGSEFLSHVLGIMLYKRISDTWQEEYEQLEATATFDFDPHNPDDHRFQVPDGALWQDIRACSTNVGERLNRALEDIGRANPRLRSAFAGLDFNRRQFSGELLEYLLSHFDGISLRPSRVNSELLGKATEAFIAQFAEYEGKRGGEFYTPRMVSRLIVECLQPEIGMTLYDPTCGSGGMFIEAIRYIERQGRSHQHVELFGQEINPNTRALCEMNLLLHEFDHADIRLGNTLLTPWHLEETGGAVLKKFDRVIAHSPFSQSNWGHDDWKNGDRYGRDKFGRPPKNFGDLAYLQHVIASLKDDGIAGVVLPQAALTRSGPEASIRDRLLQDDLIEAVIGLAPNLFYGTGGAACVVILNKKKARTRQGKILFVQGAREAREGSYKNVLESVHVERLAHAYQAFRDVPQFCRVVDLNTLRTDSQGLSIDYYVELPREPRRIVRSIVDYLEVINEIANEQKPGTTLFYRGHGSMAFKLVPSIYREGTYVAVEDKMYKELIMSDPQDFSDDHSALEKLVRMQHYNLPTRLLDLTLNPLVALYFACKHEKKWPDGEIIFLAIPDSEIKFYDSDAVSIVANLAKRPIEDKRELQHLTQNPEFSTDTYKREILDEFNGIVTVERLLHEIREEKSYFLGKINPNDLSRVICVKAKRNNKRIVAQEGVFLLFGLGRQIDEPAQVPDAWVIRSNVGAIVVDQKSKGNILKELERLNIRDSTLFPDIEKTAMHVKKKYSSTNRQEGAIERWS